MHVVRTDTEVTHVSIHSDKITVPSSTLFVALPGNISDGHHYLAEAYATGVRVFMITDASHIPALPDADIVVVADALEALQKLATHHRTAHPDLLTLGITGSNGKTVVKEWLYQLLCDNFYIVKSPKSYNSQVGMPLSIFQMSNNHELGIFEAGISQVGEMRAHARMLRPQVGIFTNIGDAHDAGFESRSQKVTEKLLLFEDTELLIYCKDHTLIHEQVRRLYPNKKTLTWAMNEEADINVEVIGDSLAIHYLGQTTNVVLPFVDKASIENILHCISFMLSQNIDLAQIEQKLPLLSGVNMRLEMKAGIQNSIVINDAYSADLSGLAVALEFMQKQGADREKILILSALDQSGMTEDQVLQSVIALLTPLTPIQCLYLSATAQTTTLASDLITLFADKASLLRHLAKQDLSQKTILVKGARKEKLEDIVYKLSSKGHSTRLTVNLDALEHNIRVYRSLLKQDTGIIAVVKAGAYGSGSVEVARTLSRSGVRYLAVAFVDEAISLRKQGIRMPIIVFNADLMSMQDVLRYQLELEVYTLAQLHQLSEYLNGEVATIRIHFKLDTGMHRLGFTGEQLAEAIDVLQGHSQIEVASVFSHLASSEDPSDDTYTRQQFSLFDQYYGQLCSALSIQPPRHILNSSGISRFAGRQYELVRLGLGLYGIDSGGVLTRNLRKVHTLTSTLLQVKNLYKGDSIGYNRKTILKKDTLTGVVNIGYADGLLRNVGNRKYSVVIGGKLAAILGTVSMDLVIVDLSEVPEATVGMDVIIFDERHTIEALAYAADTIPYEILSRISERVERVYISQ